MATVAGPAGKFLISYLPSRMPLLETVWPRSLTKVIVPALRGFPVPARLTVPVMFPRPWQPTSTISAIRTNPRRQNPPHRRHRQTGRSFIVLLALALIEAQETNVLLLPSASGRGVGGEGFFLAPHPQPLSRRERGVAP